ncbi:MAG: organic radical activating enzyme [Rickettsiales bacterium]|jgi:organic radical activating enzyme
MFGSNPILPPKSSDGKKLDIQEIFKTFQGEGIFTGYPAIFIRLGGCNLACKFCDTEFDSFEEMSLEKITQKTIKLAKTDEERTHNLVVITGGEPLRQNIKPLCDELLKEGFEVQIETNGTLFQELPKKVNIVCSPKNSSGKYYQIREDLLANISAFKFLISTSNKKYNFVPDIGQSKFRTPVYLQPIDEYDEKKNEKNRKLVLKLAAANGCRISLQTHKFWKIS